MTIVGHRRISSEYVIPLHATKGWRAREYLKSGSEQFPSDVFLGYFRRIPPTQRSGFQFLNEAARLASLTRHSWYRRKLAAARHWESIRRAAGEPPEMPLEGETWPLQAGASS